MPVRLATSYDEDGLVECAVLENREKGFSVADTEIVRERVRMLVSRDGGLMGVIKGSDGVQAAIAVVIAQFWNTRDFHMEKLFSYVRPQYRRTDHARDLVMFAKMAANQMGLTLIFAEGIDAMPTDMQMVAEKLQHAIPRSVRQRHRDAFRVQWADPKTRFFERQMSPAGTVFVHQPMKDEGRAG